MGANERQSYLIAGVQLRELVTGSASRELSKTERGEEGFDESRTVKPSRASSTSYASSEVSSKKKKRREGRGDGGDDGSDEEVLSGGEGNKCPMSRVVLELRSHALKPLLQPTNSCPGTCRHYTSQPTHSLGVKFGMEEDKW